LRFDPLMSTHAAFMDRSDAGRRLALALERYRGADTIVVGLPRGGVPVASEVARALGAPLDVCVVRKVGAPGNPEHGIGAVAEGGALYLDREAIGHLGASDEVVAELVRARRAEVEDRVLRLRGGAPAADVDGKTVLIVDDGVATGGTARAAVQALRARGAGRVILAVPVGAEDSVRELGAIADEVVCLLARADLHAVSLWYDDFRPTTDEEVVALLARAWAERCPRTRSERVPVVVDREVHIPLAGSLLEGHLNVPGNPKGLVLFAHGSGSSRMSGRNRYVARELGRAGLATLLFDLLTEDEERVDARTARLRFDITILAERLGAATDWTGLQHELQGLPLGYFGASTGAAAALVAAAERPALIRAVVSRGGRPDLAGGALIAVQAPTLLLVGSEDRDVLALNELAIAYLHPPKELEVVPGATHLFEEPGALEHVARSAVRWFQTHLVATGVTFAASA